MIFSSGGFFYSLSEQPGTLNPQQRSLNHYLYHKTFIRTHVENSAIFKQKVLPFYARKLAGKYGCSAQVKTCTHFFRIF
jgi:hypothetical protein